ncbi:sulfotransferase family protein [Croceicoccus bisphenolivorans]|uniref:sulfotransferase family protein n=1 Tax=Croceicoccus bisphenolivorans TaxID=1783232 RepID=UPI000831E100|nr:sulfotransferase [Croceicoccus bisphenolivorans]
MGSFRWYYNRIKSYVGRPRLIVQEKPVLVDESVRCDHPLFLLGAHRSGTSLVRRMINSHPDIACPPETFYIARYVEMMQDEETAAGYEGFGFGAAEMRNDLARKASSLHEAFRLSQGKAIWADKTPQYLQIAEEIDRLFDARPRYILISRHPLDIAHSIWKRGWKFVDIDDPFEAALIYARQCAGKLDAFAASHPDRCGRLHYAELCAYPEAALTKAMEAVGLSYHPEMLKFGEKQHNFGLEDPVIRGKKSVEASAGAWQGWNAGGKRRATEIFGEAVLDPAYIPDSTAMPPMAAAWA